MRRRTPRPNKTHAGAAREAQRLFRLAVPKALGITEAGTALVVADDAAAQREALELGTAAVADDAAFASSTHAHSASDITSGTIATARLGSGTANSTTFLRGDQTYAAPTASVALNTESVAFTDGDTVRRVTVSDASITASDKILVTVRREDTADGSEDSGHIYIANVVRVGTGSFDVVVVCLDEGGSDTTEQPPNETIELVWTRAA